MIHTFVNTIYVFLGDPMFNSEEEDVAVYWNRCGGSRDSATTNM